MAGPELKCEQAGTTAANVAVAVGYWRPNLASIDNIVECDNPAFCDPSSRDNTTYSSADDACSPRHVGPRCELCVNGSARIYALCETCADRPYDWLLLLLFGVGMLAVAAGLYLCVQRCRESVRRARRGRARPRRDSERLRKLLRNRGISEKLKVFVSFTQQIATFTESVSLDVCVCVCIPSL